MKMRKKKKMGGISFFSLIFAIYRPPPSTIQFSKSDQNEVNLWMHHFLHHPSSSSSFLPNLEYPPHPMSPPLHPLFFPVGDGVSGFGARGGEDWICVKPIQDMLLHQRNHSEGEGGGDDEEGVQHHVQVVSVHV